MRSFLRGARMPALHLALLCVLTIPASSQEVAINELFNSSLSTDEWVEFLVVGETVDLRGWSIQDFSSSGAPAGVLTFSNAALWSSVAKGTIVVVGQSGASFTEDTDPSDKLLLIKASNGIYFSGTAFLLAGASEAVQIRNGSAVHVFGVSWGAANASSIPSPKAHFAPGSTSNTATLFNGGSTAALTSTANWTQNSAATTRGAGNGATNSAWITTLRGSATGDGSGTASVDPDTIDFGVTTDLRVTYRRDNAYTVTDMRLVLPGSFAWSRDTGSVVSTNMSATVSVAGDTVLFSGLSLSADSSVITIESVTAPETTGLYPVVVQTKAQTAFGSVSPSPQVVVFGLPLTIAEVKTNDANGIPLKLGSLVTIRGVVTVANQFGGPSYIQDNTGGMAIFGSSFSTAVAIGDEVTVSGKVDPFNGLTEITSPILHTNWSSGNPVDPPVVTCAELFGDGAGGQEEFEGRFVRLNAVSVTDTFGTPIANWTVSGAGTNYRISDATGHVDIRVDNNADFANTPAPQGVFDISGVVSQFKTTSPFIGGYQLMPRQAADILAAGPIIASSPVESDLTPSSFTVSWTTVNGGTTRLRYGTTASYELGVLAPDDVLRTGHSVGVTGLQAATIYHVGAFSVAGGDTSSAADLVVSTTSPPGSTGQINVYFNKTVNTSVALGELALGNQDLISRIVQRINAAHRSIDVCVYNLSGAGEGEVIAAALVAAKNRGVKVRVVCEYDNSTNAPFATLSSNGIPLITDRYDQIWFGQGLMHNKFFVFDYRGGAPESVWVWSGSWNPTNPGTNSDRQNGIEIQDVALAGAYTAEFSEMWGSSGDAPNQSSSRFGARKTNNVPHSFIVNAVPLSVYFSPSDQTTSRIRTTLGKATHSVAAALLTLTRKDIADTVISRKNAGRKTRLLLDNNTDTNNQFSYLAGAGVDIRLKGGSGLLHHKYAAVDADDPSATQYLITGSHNWSNNAENSNDENTLIIQDQRIANLYLQEFAARYYEAGGTDSIRLTAAPSFSLSASLLDFDSVAVGSSKTDSFTVSNAGDATLTVGASSDAFRMFVSPSGATIAPGDSARFYVTFAPVASSLSSGGIVLVHSALGSPDTVSVQGVGSVPAGMVGVPFEANRAWNMVSLPVHATDSVATAIFPSANSLVFSFEAGYQAQETLRVGTGYWAKFPADTLFGIVGYPATTATIQVSDRWNLIGSISSSVPAASVTPGAGTAVASPYYTYDAGYLVATTIHPGHAYWVKVNGSGTLTLSASGQQKGMPSENPLAALSSIRFSDEGGGGQTLYLASDVHDGFDASAYELPPAAPAGGFDARFASGSMAELLPPHGEASGEVGVSVNSRFSSIKVAWRIDSQERNSYTLSAENGRGTIPIRLEGEGETSLPASPTGRYTISVGPTSVMPTSAVLLQNYPNPFNPVTTIPYALPAPSTVTLTVFNVLGEAVAMLVNREERSAGYHAVQFDASRLSSGIYYYQLQASGKDQPAPAFQQVKKLLLIR